MSERATYPPKNMSHSIREQSVIFTDEWLVWQQGFLDQFLIAWNHSSAESDEQRQRHLIEQVMCRYQQYFHEKSKTAKDDIFVIFSPSWLSSFEKALLWLAGFKPSTILRVVNGAMREDLTAEQAAALEVLKSEQAAALEALENLTVHQPPYSPRRRQKRRRCHALLNPRHCIQSDIVSATRIFDSIPVPDVVSWTTMISGLSKCGLVEEAMVKFMSMDVEPNLTTLVTVLSSCSTSRAFRFGKAIQGYCLRKFHERNLIWDNAVLDFYLRCGNLASARYLFVNMPKRDVVSWTIMVGGYAQSGLCEKAIELFQQLVQGGEAEPNEATIVNILSACSSICALRSGREVHSYVSSRRDLTVNVNVGNALINMYVKCGNLGLAILVFKALECKDVISWSTIISGMAMNGHGVHVLQLFSSMLVNGVSPDGVTFLGLLAACSHAGLVDQGLIFFNAMKKVYHIVPETQHYACLVDMYGRAGLLEEAEAFIKEMPTEADGPVWGALLNACKIHGNEEMVERIRQGVLSSPGVSIGTYALLSNAYADHDRWDDSNKVRDEMRDMGLKTPAGRSWIEIGLSI